MILRPLRMLPWLLLIWIMLMPASVASDDGRVVALVRHETLLDRVQAQSVSMTPLARITVDGEEWLVVTTNPASVLASGMANNELQELAFLEEGEGELFLFEYSPDLTPGLDMPDLDRSGTV